MNLRQEDAGNDTGIRFAIGPCALGNVLVARSSRGILAIFLGDDPAMLTRTLLKRFPAAQYAGDEATFRQLTEKVGRFIDAPAGCLDLPLDMRGTAFQESVWQALCEIPSGTTASYTDIAERIGAPRSVRAVAQACGANLIAVAIPCHRVVRRDGGLSGYRWGVERKRDLLSRENVTRLPKSGLESTSSSSRSAAN